MLYNFGRWGVNYQKALKTHAKGLLIGLALLVAMFVPSFCFGVEPTAGDFSLDPAGQFYILDKDDFGTYPPYDCTWYFYYGVYPTQTILIGNGITACQNIAVPRDLEIFLTGYPTLFGDFWFSMENYPAVISRYYTPLPRVDVGVWGVPPTAISITSPANHSTITDLATQIDVVWQGINHEIYPYIWLSFIDTKIYEHSEIYSFLITADSGEIEIPLTEFGFSKNGQWDFRATAEYDANTFLDLTPEPPYYLIFDVESLPEPYYFSDFDTWYGENVDDYEAPSEWASAMVGYLEPIFGKIGEFGTRITSYLDTSDAYERGWDIGKVFPVIIAYVSKIDMFFGDFPLITFFKWLILIMIGLFVVKIILKLLSFIPFFGGGG